MKAPDKIYVGIQDLGSRYATSVSITPQEGHSEYIRKDALLDWLESMFYQHNEHILAAGFNTAIEQVYDKLNSM